MRVGESICRAAHLLAAALIVPGCAMAIATTAAAQSPAPPQPSPVLEVEVAPGPHTIGDRVAVTLTVTAEPGELTEPPRFPAWGEPPEARWGEAEVVAAGPVEESAAPDGRTAWRQTVTVAAFATGRVALPPRAVALPLAGGTVQTHTPEGLGLAIASVLPPPADGAEGAEETPPPPRPPAPPRQLPLGAPFWWALAVGSLLVAAALWAAFRRRRGEAAGAAPPLAPFEELRRAVAALPAAGSPAAGHTALSLAVRRYLGRSLGFPAAESSTTEIQRALAARPLPAGVGFRAVELLRACDLVKFARRPADEEALGRRGEAALALGGEIETHLAPPPEAESPAAGGREEAA